MIKSNMYHFWEDKSLETSCSHPRTLAKKLTKKMEEEKTCSLALFQNSPEPSPPSPGAWLRTWFEFLENTIKQLCCVWFYMSSVQQSNVRFETCSSFISPGQVKVVTVECLVGTWQEERAQRSSRLAFWSMTNQTSSSFTLLYWLLHPQCVGPTW